MATVIYAKFLNLTPAYNRTHRDKGWRLVGGAGEALDRGSSPTRQGQSCIS